MNNVILIGFMGVGKGRTARALARATGRFAVDTDDLIESKSKLKIRKIFSGQGEPAFRRLEQEVALWLEHRLSGTIVSTGGGFFQVDNIQRLGTVIYLHAGVEAIIQAIKEHPKGAAKIKKRPLLQDLDAARKLFAQRLSSYRAAADYEVEVEGQTREQVVAAIRSLPIFKGEDNG
ncbi:shikimate kinase [Desulfogranum mediterraneum]|uniref:shikimate kinase n=1 Tax=Desulfogranum mediterraneum TaxID=160661 RepID=UPI00040049EB|nr:shikimate kinase [Desulfogranum mediterraneum]